MHWEAAVEELYAAFASVPRPAELPGCPCCVGPDAGAPLLARPLRRLSAEELATYAFRALTTWGDVAEFRYFAPRLLELAADDAFGWPDPEIVFGKLALAGWRDWPEQRAITAFLEAFWARTLAEFPARPDAGTALSSIAQAVDDLAPYLAAWERLDTGASIRHLHDFVTEKLVWRHGRPRLHNALWDRVDGPYHQTLAWLVEGPAAEAVAAAFERADEEELLELLVAVEGMLRP